MVTKNDANLALLSRFRQVLIESPLQHSLEILSLFFVNPVAKDSANDDITISLTVRVVSDGKAFFELAEISGVGEKKAGSLRDFFCEEDNIKMVNDLASQLKIEPVSANVSNSPLSGKIVVFTGTLLKMDRKTAQAEAESLGAIVSSSVSNKTAFLVVGEKPGSKYKKAMELGIRILTEEEWVAALPSF
ncbi:DNA ligase [Trichonephila clavipes]|nr:DNA ligase [Trichonephila clavipes]